LLYKNVVVLWQVVTAISQCVAAARARVVPSALEAQGARLVKGTLTASEVTLTVILFIVVGFAIAKVIELFFF